MGSKIHPRTWERYDKHRAKGKGQRESARLVGISPNTAWLREKRIKEEEGFYGPGSGLVKITGSGKHSLNKAGAGAYVPENASRGAIDHDKLCEEAKRALSDFAYFRRRYFGRRSTPWQEDAVGRCIEFLETKRKEYVVINCPPGSGKSTTFTLELAAFITARNRGIRGMIGSASQTLAERYLLRLRNALEAPWPMRAETEEIDLGLAFDAEASLVSDFGIFKPENAPLWSAHAFIVAQHDDRPITEKEPTWSAYGLDTAFIGGRFDVAIWDDATEDKYLRTEDTIEKQRDRWDKVAEKRLEPGGLLILQGQRLSPEDLYRHNLDKKAGSSEDRDHSECCTADNNRKYHHIVYRAHYEDRCVEDHDPGEYFPKGCLLDPHRLEWRELEAEMENSASNFAQVYQQEDVDPTQTLVDPFWIKGGTHPVTHEIFPGCWDHERSVWQIPQLSLPFVAYLCVDPSPTKMWGLTLWVYHPESQLRFLIDVMNAKLQIGQFFDWSDPKGKFVGILTEWYEKSIECGFPIATLVFEANAAQRFFLATDALRRWQQQTGVRVIGHETFAKNKLDSELGPQQLAGLYKRGLVRLPGGDDTSRLHSMRLVEEVCKYPMGRRDDLVMSQWFGEFQLPHIYAREPKVRFTHRPSWMKEPAIA